MHHLVAALFHVKAVTEHKKKTWTSFVSTSDVPTAEPLMIFFFFCQIQSDFWMKFTEFVSTNISRSGLQDNFNNNTPIVCTPFGGVIWDQIIYWAVNMFTKFSSGIQHIYCSAMHCLQ